MVISNLAAIGPNAVPVGVATTFIAVQFLNRSAVGAGSELKPICCGGPRSSLGSSAAVRWTAWYASRLAAAN